jgi:hypothetical protein
MTLGDEQGGFPGHPSLGGDMLNRYMLRADDDSSEESGEEGEEDDASDVSGL